MNTLRSGIYLWFLAFITFGNITAHANLKEKLEILCGSYIEGMTLDFTSLGAVAVNSNPENLTVPYYLEDFKDVPAEYKYEINKKNNSCDYTAQFKVEDNEGNDLEGKLSFSLKTDRASRRSFDRVFTDITGNVQFGDSKTYPLQGRFMGRSGSAVGFSSSLHYSKDDKEIFGILNLQMWGD